MGISYKQQEEELDLWYNEDKERVEKIYLKRLAKTKKSFNPEEEEENKEPVMSLSKIQRLFIADQNKGRNKYQAKYSKIQASKERRRKGNMFLLTFFFPMIWLGKRLWKLLLILREQFIKGFKAIIKGWKAFKVFMDNIKYVIGEFCTFHIDPHIVRERVVFRRFRKFFSRPVNKLWVKLMDIKKKLIESIMKKISFVIGFVMKIIKKIQDIIKKYGDKYASFQEKLNGKIFELKEKYWEPIVVKLKDKFSKE